MKTLAIAAMVLCASVASAQYSVPIGRSVVIPLSTQWDSATVAGIQVDVTAPANAVLVRMVDELGLPTELEGCFGGQTSRLNGTSTVTTLLSICVSDEASMDVQVTPLYPGTYTLDIQECGSYWTPETLGQSECETSRITVRGTLGASALRALRR